MMYPTIIQMDGNELRQRVVESLAARGVTDWTNLDVRVEYVGVVVVSGRSASLRDKLFCLECCRRVAGVVQVTDQLNVQPNRSAVDARSTTTAIAQWIANKEGAHID